MSLDVYVVAPLSMSLSKLNCFNRFSWARNNKLFLSFPIGIAISKWEGEMTDSFFTMHKTDRQFDAKTDDIKFQQKDY